MAKFSQHLDLGPSFPGPEIELEPLQNSVGRLFE